MLVLTRKIGQAVRIGNVRIVISKVGRGAVRIGIDAPREVPIVREELDEDSGGGTAADRNPKQDPDPDSRPAAPSSGPTSRPHRSGESRCGLSGSSTMNNSTKPTRKNPFRPLRRARRRNPDAGSMARLNPGFRC